MILEQMAKLHRAIYEELYFEKMTKFDGDNIEATSSNAFTANEFDNNSLQEEKSSECLKKKSRTDYNPQLNYENPLPSDRLNDDDIKNKLNVKSNKIRTEKSLKENKSFRSLVQDKETNNIAFDVWVKEKTKAMKRMLNQEREKKQQAEQIQIERKRASDEVRLRDHG